MKTWKIEKENNLHLVKHLSKTTGTWITMSEWSTEESAIIDMICWEK